ncbi:hypothetical protein WJX72_001011 [[Myrmecia] bisecta]|uniref:WAT1-related protein n=1 Tax=[Myrmecia] bisecta TaxID=41462 RepID=A0AAW1R4D2_9CHLO
MAPSTLPGRLKKSKRDAVPELGDNGEYELVIASEIPETPTRKADGIQPTKAWHCQVALAITQTAFCVGSVYLKSCLKKVDSSKGESFHPIIYAFLREVIAGPIMCCLAFYESGALPKRADLLRVGALGLCLFFNQLFFIIGIDLSGVVVATCMQPTIPVFTAMIAVMLQLEQGSLQKFLGIGLAVGGSVCMVLGGVSGSGHHTAAEGRNMLLGNLCLLANTLAMALYFLSAKQLVQSVLFGPLLYWIFICSVVGYYVVTWATQFLPASQVAAFQCLQPFVGTVLAFFVLGEEPSLWDLGAVGVVVGLITIAKDKGALEASPIVTRLRKIMSHPTALAALYKPEQKL